jgi:hypothetical protein
MSVSFDPTARSVLVPVIVVGPRRPFRFRFALDTGATQTVLSATLARNLGFDFNHPISQARVRSATGTARVPVFRSIRVSALDQTRDDFLLAAQDFPLGVQADGLLGLDFYRGLVLRLDFARGRASLNTPSRWRFWR